MAKLDRDAQARLIHAWGLTQIAPAEWRGPCPARAHSSNKTSPPLSMMAGSSEEAYIKCHAGCDWGEIQPAIAQALGSRYSPQPARQTSPPRAQPAGKPKATTDKPEPQPAEPQNENRVAKARKLWADGMALAHPDARPARLWLELHGLDTELAACALKWQPQHRALIAPLASPRAWLGLEKTDKPVMAVALVYIDDDGKPRLDPGGLNKRSYGPTRGLITMIAPARLAEARAIFVTEGLKDALALAKHPIATRLSLPVIATHGTAGMKALEWERTDQSLVFAADNDRSGAGLAAAHAAAGRHIERGGQARVLTPKEPDTDPYDALARARQSLAERER